MALCLTVCIVLEAGSGAGVCRRSSELCAIVFLILQLQALNDDMEDEASREMCYCEPQQIEMYRELQVTRTDTVYSAVEKHPTFFCFRYIFLRQKYASDQTVINMPQRQPGKMQKRCFDF